MTLRWLWCALALAACGGEARTEAKVANAIDAAPPPRVVDRKLAQRSNLAGDRLVRDGKLDGAIREYEAALDADPSHAQAASNLAWTRFLAGDLDGAARDGERALALAAGDAALTGAALYNLGRIAERRGDLETAKRRYRDSLRARPHAGVAARLAGLETDAEREEDADLLASAHPPPPDRKIVQAASLRAAMEQCAVTEPIFAEDEFALARARDDGSLVAIARVANRRYASLVLGGGDAPTVTAGVQPRERVVLGERVWFLRPDPDGILVILELPRGYSWLAVDRDLVVTADEGTPPDPEGPEGRWRLVEGVYRKLVL